MFDDLKIYNYALSEEEVGRLFATESLPSLGDVGYLLQQEFVDTDSDGASDGREQLNGSDSKSQQSCK